jgi:hypothetical protein
MKLMWNFDIYITWWSGPLLHMGCTYPPGFKIVFVFNGKINDLNMLHNTNTWWSGPLLCMACMSQPCFLFYFYFKTEELVHSGLCAMHLGHNSIFPSARITALSEYNGNVRIFFAASCKYDRKIRHGLGTHYDVFTTVHCLKYTQMLSKTCFLCLKAKGSQ